MAKYGIIGVVMEKRMANSKMASERDIRLLRRFRRLHDITLIELGKAAGCCHSRLSIIELGGRKITIAEVKRLRAVIRAIVVKRDNSA